MGIPEACCPFRGTICIPQLLELFAVKIIVDSFVSGSSVNPSGIHSQRWLHVDFYSEKVSSLFFPPPNFVTVALLHFRIGYSGLETFSITSFRPAL